MSLSGTLLSRFENIRRATTMLTEPLSDEDCCVQSMTDASPVKWHLAHTTWFFETFVLERFEPAFQPFNGDFRMLYNSYYNSIGEQYPRSRRGLITRPSMDEVHEYRNDINARVASLILIAAAPAGEPRPEIEQLIELGLQHEQQHQELILTDLKHLLWHNPLRPAYCSQATVEAATQPLHWPTFEGGLIEIGSQADSFCYDNELPRHKQFLEPYALGSRLITNAEYLAFMNAGGYQNPSLWLSEGWAWLKGEPVAIAHPLYWQETDGAWQEFTLHGLLPLNPEQAAIHLSYYEADAYARWAGARLPTEAEWENAAAPPAQGSSDGTPADAPQLEQLFDTAWQWTSSSYAPYPGFKPPSGAIGEYNGKFMVNQYVLRGGSCVTPPDHSRATYRNFFPSHARWQYTGLRLARSL
ncbi:MAG TPA: ergothioneine biosynthesis protein EgtB [Pusillimonas sp.]|uniref:ergothioneine biosynthesis protein EgtB n=1 Tax=Pusillimonas sp. TaxID=3040095 RepID=UPI002CE0863E|nr:ergothioneine biosynthesis protein EgtB [Pusillimonas sp.]HUH87909.1 ergothioneine biosynthesis protein EgtB [Pusillimonas sp.]